MNTGIEMQGPVTENLGRKHHYKLYTVRYPDPVTKKKKRTTISMSWADHKNFVQAFGSERELARRVHHAVHRIIPRGWVTTLSGTVVYELNIEAGLQP